MDCGYVTKLEVYDNKGVGGEKPYFQRTFPPGSYKRHLTQNWHLILIMQK